MKEKNKPLLIIKLTMTKIDISEKDKKLLDRLNNSDSTIDTRAAHVFETLFLNKYFKDFVEKIREIDGVPQGGYSNDRKEDFIEEFYIDERIENFSEIKFDEERDYEKGIKFNRMYSEIKMRQFLSDNNLFYSQDKIGKYSAGLVMCCAREYILFGDFFGVNTRLGFISRSNEKNKEDEIRINFVSDISKKEAKEFIDKNWDHIEKVKNSIKGEDNKNKTFPRKKFVRNCEIFNCNEKFKNNSDQEEGYKVSKVKKELGLDLELGTIRKQIHTIRERYNEINKDSTKLDFLVNKSVDEGIEKESDKVEFFNEDV
jgi:hypothetical protein